MRSQAPRLSMATGNDKFLDGLYRAHQRELCSYIRRKYGPGPPEPEDIAQGAFARFAALKNRQEIPNPKAFLMLTARNLVIDARRRVSTAAGAEPDLRQAQENDHDPSAEDVLSSREELNRLATIVADLKPKQRLAFLMHRLDGLSYVEIGQRMKMSETGARQLVIKAMAICIARMKDRP